MCGRVSTQVCEWRWLYRVSLFGVSLAIQSRDEIGLRDYSGKPLFRVQHRDMVVPIVREHRHQLDDWRRRVDGSDIDVHQGADKRRRGDATPEPALDGRRLTGRSAERPLVDEVGAGHD